MRCAGLRGVSDILLLPRVEHRRIADRAGKAAGEEQGSVPPGRQLGRHSFELRARRSEPLEGLTWPDTYLVGANETEDQILYKIVPSSKTRRAAAGERAEPRLTPTRCWSLAHPGRVRQRSRLAAHLRSDRESPSRQDAAPDRRHVVLRKGWMPTRARRRRQEDRFALQHLQADGSAAHADRDGQRERARGRAQSGVRPLQVLRLRQERQDVLRNDEAEHERNVEKARSAG